MKPTGDNSDEMSEATDQSRLALLIIGIMCLIGVAIGIMKEPSQKETMVVEIPDQSAAETADRDSVYSLYLLGNDSAALSFGEDLIVSTLEEIFSDSLRVIDMNNRIVLIKPLSKSDYKGMVDALDGMNIHNVQRFALVRCDEGEFENLLKRWKERTKGN